MIGTTRSRTLELRFFVLFDPTQADDAQLARGLEDASQIRAVAFREREAMAAHVAALDPHALAVAVISPGVAAAEQAAQQLLRANSRLHVVMLAAPGDNRSLGERFRTVPIRARQIELLPLAEPDLPGRIAAAGRGAWERRTQREQLTEAGDLLPTLRPHALDLTGGTIRRQLLEALPVGVVVATADGFVAQANAAAYRMLQLEDSRGAAQRGRLGDLIPQWSRLAADALPAEDVVTINRDGTTDHLRLQTSPLAGNNTVSATLIVIENISEREEARRVLTSTAAELEHRMLQESRALLEAERERDSIKHFIASLTHDLRSPVAAAMLSSQLLQRQASMQEGTAGTLLQRVSRNLERLERMVEDLLDLTRHDMGSALTIEPRPMRLDVLLQETLDDLAQLYGRKIGIEQPLPVADGCWDPDGLRRIIENLGSNAIKYGALDKPADVRLDVGADDVSLHFRNYGPVIPLTAQKVIFEPFYRAETPAQQRIPGWGVGLAFVRVMTQYHGGSVTVSSSEAHGTIFSVRLPKACPQR